MSSVEGVRTKSKSITNNSTRSQKSQPASIRIIHPQRSINVKKAVPQQTSHITSRRTVKKAVRHNRRSVPRPNAIKKRKATIQPSN